jgi:hypothetical protein
LVIDVLLTIQTGYIVDMKGCQPCWTAADIDGNLVHSYHSSRNYGHWNPNLVMA